jgi:hypothetical protein
MYRKILAGLLLCCPVLHCARLLAAAPDSKQEDPARFNYFVNDWNVLGLKDYQRGARVTPDNAIMLAGKGVVVRVRYGQALKPLTHDDTKTLMDGWLPVMEIGASDGPVQYQFHYWAAPMPNVKEWNKAYDWPTEGENFLVWVRYKATNTADKPATAKVDIRIDPKAKYPDAPEAPAEPKVDASQHGSYAIDKELAPGAGIEGAARFAFIPVKDAAMLDKEDPKVWLDRTAEYWRGVEKPLAGIHVPCLKATNALRFAHVTQLIASDHGQVHGGEGFYDVFYMRDGAYQIMEYGEFGLWETARKSLESYFSHQRPDGRFESQQNQWDANGQTPWAFLQYYKMTGDRPWLERAFPAMKKSVEWTMKARRQAPADGPFAGLLPPGPGDGECLWDGKHHIVGYDVWNLRGMICTAEAARILGKTDEAESLDKEVRLYREAIDAAVRRTGLAYFPPSWEKEGTSWGNLETIWPSPIFDAKDPRVAATIQRVRKETNGGFVEGIMQWLGQKDVIHPYAGVYSVMADLVADKDEQVVEDFYWYLLHSSASQAFPEGIYYKRRYAWGETIPHVTGACNYAFLLRHMLVHEQGDELHLLKAVPDWWLAEGQEIRIERLPTWFGKMDLTLRGTASGVQMKFAPPTRQRPVKIVLHLPENRALESKVDGVVVATRKPQAVKWDFPAVVERYRKLGQPAGAGR